MSSFGGISFTGLASGLDTAAIVRALVAAERRPMALLEARRDTLSGERDLFGRAAGLLGTLRDAADALTDPDSFRARRASVSREGSLAAAVGTGATAGTWSVVVERLATAQVNQSAPQADPDAALFAAGTLQFTVGGVTSSVDVAAGASLNDVATAIRATDGVGVRAEVVDTGGGAWRLVLRAEATGVEGFELTAEGGAALKDFVATTMATPIQAGQDARLRVDGVTLERSTNRIDDAIAGVTLDLLAAGDSLATTVTVETDSDAVADRVASFVDAYNAWRGFVANQTALDGDRRGALLGDGLMRGIADGLRTILGAEATGANSAYALLSQVGVTAATDGTLSFDQAAFATALETDPDAIIALFGAPAGGIATALTERLGADLDRVDGSLAIRRGSLDDRIAALDGSIRRSERRLEQTTARLEARFAALETTLARLQAQGNALGGLGLFGL